MNVYYCFELYDNQKVNDMAELVVKEMGRYNVEKDLDRYAQLVSCGQYIDKCFYRFNIKFA